MITSIEVILFYILLVDSVAANLIVWLVGDRFYVKHFRSFSRLFPLTKGWSGAYLILILWIGSLLSRSGFIGY